MIALFLVIATQTAVPVLPRDVRGFVERRRECDHWRGEYSPDKLRQREIDRAAKRTCGGTDRQLDRLRRIHRQNPAAIAALDDFGHVERR